MPGLLADVLANLFMHVADVVAISFVADVVAIDVSCCGRCYCHHLCWLMLLPFYVLL